jgi:hypothetical protein
MKGTCGEWYRKQNSLHLSQAVSPWSPFIEGGSYYIVLTVLNRLPHSLNTLKGKINTTAFGAHQWTAAMCSRLSMPSSTQRGDTFAPSGLHSTFITTFDRDSLFPYKMWASAWRLSQYNIDEGLAGPSPAWTAAWFSLRL